MKLFKKRIKYSDIKVVLDIRSSSVGAGVITSEKDKPPMIHWTQRERVIPDSGMDVNLLIKDVYKKIDKLLSDVVTKGLPSVKGVKLKDRSIDEVYCVFASPWYESRIKNFNVSEKGQIHFTKEYFNKILNKEKEVEKPAPGRVQIDKKILSVLMNGYETENPFNKKADSLILSFYSSFISEKTRDDLEQRIKRNLNTKNIHFSTHPLVTISAIKSIFHALNNFILIDVGGEITDISLFKNSMLQSIVTIPSGINSFIRSVSEKCSMDKENAISQLNVICDERFDKKCVESTMEVLKGLKMEYLKKIGDSILSTWGNEAIPPTIFVTVDNEAQDMMKKILTSKESYMDTFKLKREPMLHIINTRTVEDFATYSKNSRKDSLISIISNYFVNI